jgi:hypothetical protein
MIIKTPIQELEYVLDFFNKVYKEDQETIASEFLKYFIKTKQALEYAEKQNIIDSYDAGTCGSIYKAYHGLTYYYDNFVNNE